MAGAIALGSLAGIGINLANRLASGMEPAAAIWRLLGYFTILTNAMLVVIYGLAAIRGARFHRPRLFAFATASIGLVGGVYLTLLSGSSTLEGARVISNALLHYAAPLLVAGHWAAFVEKGRLTWRDPFVWALWPVAYLPYALTRGHLEGRFVYPFIDVGALGAVAVVLNCLAIAAAFALAGLALVALDRWMARHGERRGGAF